MKVFLSWSGDLSKRLAEALRDWLPNVLQAVKPWMSSEDIEKGARWSTDIAGELEQTKAGILCVTPDNFEAPWLIFEAGALSKTIENTLVSPYLLGLRPSDLNGPLVQFQQTQATKSDTKKLVNTLNRAIGDAGLSEKQLDKTFEIWWPDLLSSLEKLEVEKTPQRPRRSDRELLEEILALVRGQVKEGSLALPLLSAACESDLERRWRRSVGEEVKHGNYVLVSAVPKGETDEFTRSVRERARVLREKISEERDKVKTREEPRGNRKGEE